MNALIERLIASHRRLNGEIRREHLPEDFFEDLRCEAATGQASNAGSASIPQGGSLQDVATSAIAAALARHGGNVSAVARELGVSRNTIYRRMPGLAAGRSDE